MVKWGFANEDKCECGEVQSMDHLLICSKLPTKCTTQDLVEANKNAIDVAKYWENIFSDLTIENSDSDK